MESKTVNISIPINECIPDIISSFSLEENFLMLKIGSEAIVKGRNFAAGMSQKEIYRKIQDENKEEITKLETDLLVERELKIRMHDEISKIYNRQVEQLKKQLELANQQITSYSHEKSILIKEEVEKAKGHFDLLLQEKEKQVDKLNDTMQMLMNTNNKSNSLKGSEGEKQFNIYAQTFMDFPKFEIINKASQGGEGDFHLHFEEFDVLVDAKNYTNSVPKKERDKIKKDLIKNEHINFAWLVSLNTTVDKFDRAPIMFERVRSDKLILYINDLTSFSEPTKILRLAWFVCNEIFKVTKNDESMEDVTDLKDRQFKLNDKISGVKKTIREMNTTINVLKQQVDTVDFQLKDMLDDETEELIESNKGIFEDWWNANIEEVSDDTMVTSTDLWLQFKSVNRKLIKELNITLDKFRKYIKQRVPEDQLLIKNKQSSVLEIKGFQIKKIKIETKVIVPNEKSKVVKERKEKTAEVSYYFDEEVDTKILNEYSDLTENIMTLSEKNNMRPWQVVSILVKNKIINKRADSRGYDIYKETEEYKSKFGVAPRNI